MSELSPEEIKRKDAEYIIRPWSIKPIIIKESKGATITDVDGNEYIDSESAFFVLNIGYSHPEVVEAIKEQAGKVIQTTTFQSNIPIIELAEKIAEITPDPLNRVYYTTGGAETCENAVKMAKQFTGGFEVVALQAAYHGSSTSASSTFTGMAKSKVGFFPLVAGIYHAAPPYCYRCQFGLTYPECGLKCAQDFDRVLKTESTGQGAAVLLEPIPGAGGALIPPDDWLKEVKRICEANNLLLIADEIQTGFCRSGKFWAVEHSGVTPDIMCLSKPLGGGLPMGAVVTREDIAETFKAGIPPTFAGNALPAVAGLKTIDVLVKNRLWDYAKVIGGHINKRFNELAEKHPLIGDVRFKGLMGGIELVKDRKTKEPAAEEARKMIEMLKAEGILAFPGGISGSVFRIQPPINITMEEADKIVDAYDVVLGELES
jgi:4-aminobutyrate aminotransferase-like enzyme